MNMTVMKGTLSCSCLLSLLFSRGKPSTIRPISRNFHFFASAWNVIDIRSWLCANKGILKISEPLIAGVTSTNWLFTRHFLCHGSLDMANQGGDGFIIWQQWICHVSHHLLVTVWKHGNRSSGHAFLSVQSGRILIYAKIVMYLQIFILHVWLDLEEYAEILLYIHTFQCSCTFRIVD